MAEPPATGSASAPAFYGLTGSRWRDWWTVLHPPYTAWHLSYVVVGAALAPRPSVAILLASLGAFFLAVGVAAHAIDEWKGHPLGTQLSSGALLGTAVVALGGAVALGAIGVERQGPVLIPFIVVGAAVAVGYNAELFGGVLHNDTVFALAWGAFPVVTAYVAQARTLSVAAVAAAAAAVGLSWAQRALSSPARLLRRSAVRVDGTIELADGTVQRVERRTLLAPLERALGALSWATVAFAVALAVERLG